MATSTDITKTGPKIRRSRAECPLDGCDGEMAHEKTTELVHWFRCDTCGRALEGEPRRVA